MRNHSADLLPVTRLEKLRSGRFVASECVLLLCLMLLLTTCANAVDPYEEARQIRELRANRQYELAVEAAERLLALAPGLEDPLETAYWQAEAERLLETLHLAMSMDPGDRRILTRADSLVAEKWALGRDGRRQESIAAGEQALALYRSLLGPEHPEVIGLLSLLAQSKQGVGDLDGADRDFQLAVDLARKVHGSDSSALAGKLAAYGQFLEQYLEEHDAAERCYREAIGIYERIPDSDASCGLAIYRTQLAGVLLRQGNYHEALDLSARALSQWEGQDGGSLFRRAKMVFYPDALRTLGRSQAGLSRFEAAEESLKEALASDYVFEFFGEGANTRFATLVDLAKVQTSLGRYAETAANLRLALDLLREASDPSEPGFDDLVANLLENMAKAHHQLGRLGHAEPLLRESLAMLRSSERRDGLRLAGALRALAAVLYWQGDFLGAEDLLREALDIQISGGTGDDDLGETLKSLGTVVGKRGDYAEAERLLREAHDRSLETAPATAAQCLCDLAAMDWLRHRHEEAEELLRQALEEGRAALGDGWDGGAQLSNGLAALHATRGEFESAEELLRGVVQDLSEKRSQQRQLSASLSALGALVASRGDLAEAESLLMESAAAYERERSGIGVGYARATCWDHSPYDRLACVRVQQGRPEEAWSTAERGLARALVDFLLLTEAPELARHGSIRDSLESALSFWEGQVDAHRSLARGDTAKAAYRDFEQARAELLKVEAEWARYRASVWAGLDSTATGPIDLSSLQQCLPEDCALVGWIEPSTTPGTCEPWGYVIRRAGDVSWFRLPPFPNPAFHESAPDRARVFRDCLAEPSSAPAGLVLDGTALWRQWFAPLAETLGGIEQLLVVPSGGLEGVPIEVFVDGRGVALCEQYTISYAPSATALVQLSCDGTPVDDQSETSALILGDPPFSSSAPAEDSGVSQLLSISSGETVATRDVMRAALGGNDVALAAMPRLPGTRKEAEGIASLIADCEVLLGRDASEQNLVELAESEALRRFDVIHLATHALIDDESPEKSALVLSQIDLPDPLAAALEGSRVCDGLVTAKEITREWALDADVVALSACRTGLGREAVGEGYIGLSHAFFRAGARSVIVSLWKADDQATALLMRRFYRNWLGSRDPSPNRGPRRRTPKAQALSEAKLWLRAYEDEQGDHPYEHPYFWSAFVLLGDPW